MPTLQRRAIPQRFQHFLLTALGIAVVIMVILFLRTGAPLLSLAVVPLLIIIPALGQDAGNLTLDYRRLAAWGAVLALVLVLLRTLALTLRWLTEVWKLARSDTSMRKLKV